MKRWVIVPCCLFLHVTTATAGLFGGGIGSAMQYGPYTGGHAYSYATAYHYGFTFSPADSWRRDVYGYPGGVNPYRPFGRPIERRVFPHPDVPYISVPGPDGLPVLVRDPSVPPRPVAVTPATHPDLQPVPAQRAVVEERGKIRLAVPENAEVWFEKQKMNTPGSDRLYETEPLEAGRTKVYTVRVRWTEGAQTFEQFRVVGVRAGETARLTFGPSR